MLREKSRFARWIYDHVNIYTAADMAHADARRDAIREQRDAYKRLFNRLDAAVSHHRNNPAFKDTHDDALYKAHRKILNDAWEGKA